MLDWFEFLVLVLTCYRLAELLAIDEGPYSIFEKLRIYLGAYDYGSNGEAETSFGRLAICPYCWGIWIALLLAIVFNGFEWYTLVYWLAIAGGQSFLWRFER